jgi:hypothetical protein
VVSEDDQQSITPPKSFAQELDRALGLQAPSSYEEGGLEIEQAAIRMIRKLLGLYAPSTTVLQSESAWNTEDSCEL